MIVDMATKTKKVTNYDTSTYTKNRERKLARHQKLHPNDAQAKNVDISFRRKPSRGKNTTVPKTLKAELNHMGIHMEINYSVEAPTRVRTIK